MAWLYCRVAHEDKVALETQEKRLIAFAEESGYTIAGVSKDAGSGLTMERPGWKEAEQAVTAQGIGAVLAINSGRIARNTKELLACAERLHRQGVRLATETEGNIGKPTAAMFSRNLLPFTAPLKSAVLRTVTRFAMHTPQPSGFL